MIDPIGQLIITGIDGLVLNEDEKKFIEEENVGGVILFSKNYESPAQLAELVNSIQTLRSEYPLFISVDQEGGRVQRFKNQFIQFPSMQKVAQLDSPKMCFEIHKIIAEELSACGINLNFSPVCDILTNPENTVIGDRSFGGDSETVSKFVSAAIRGLQANGVLACAKHFPGHGGTLKDSHFDLPQVDTSYEDLKKSEFIPFLRASKSRVEFMMVAHLLCPAIDKDRPCTLSPAAYRMIREDLKFSKIVVTDDMEMKAISDHFNMAEAAVTAIAAGADMVLYRSLQGAREAMVRLKAEYKVQNLKKKDVAQKIQRVMDCKKKYFSEYTPIYIPSLEEKLNKKVNQAFLKNLTK